MATASFDRKIVIKRPVSCGRYFERAWVSCED